MSLSLCDTANLLAFETWTLLRYSYDRKRRAVDERGFTDRNLLTLEMLHRPQVWVRIFSQNREALTGADFEWWIGDGYTYLPLLVQAKRLDPDGNYASLRKRLPRSRTLQITRLIQICTTGRKGEGGQDYVGHLPAYLFYNTITPAGLPADRCCGHISSPFARGCTIAHALQVQRCLGTRPKRNSRSIKKIGPRGYPWGCLFCCPEDEMTDTAQHAKNLLEGSITGQAKGPGSEPRRFDQLPSYVLDGLEEEALPEDELGARRVDFPREIQTLETKDLPGAAVVAVTTIPRPRKEREIEVLPDD